MQYGNCMDGQNIKVCKAVLIEDFWPQSFEKRSITAMSKEDKLG